MPLKWLGVLLALVLLITMLTGAAFPYTGGGPAAQDVEVTKEDDGAMGDTAFPEEGERQGAGHQGHRAEGVRGSGSSGNHITGDTASNGAVTQSESITMLDRPDVREKRDPGRPAAWLFILLVIACLTIVFLAWRKHRSRERHSES